MNECISCGGTTTIHDGDGFPVCPSCHGLLRHAAISGIHDFELYLECWAAWRDWEAAHPVVARILNYTERP